MTCAQPLTSLKNAHADPISAELTSTSGPLTVSVVIPVLNEADRIVASLKAVSAHDVAEVIVVDGGSDDATQDLVRAVADVRLLFAAAGRGQQLHAGVTAARGDVVLMLHADTTLPDGAIPAIRASLATEGTVGGCFRLTFDQPGVVLSASAWGSRYETALTTFGDQAIFARRDVLDDLGGVPRQPLFEDVALRKLLRREGRFEKLSLAVTTSARRFKAAGPIRQQLRNSALLLAYLAGVPVARLQRFYPAQQRNRDADSSSCGASRGCSYRDPVG